MSERINPMEPLLSIVLAIVLAIGIFDIDALVDALAAQQHVGKINV